MKVITWNTNGLRARMKDGTLKQVMEQRADILCFQETKLTDGSIFSAETFLGYHIIFSLSQNKGRSGVAILSKYPINDCDSICGLTKADAEGRYARIRIGGLNIVSLYMPHGRRDKSELPYKLSVGLHLRQILQQKFGGKVLICTDFNIAHSEMDLARPKNNHNNVMFTTEERELIDGILDVGYFDVYRELKPTGNDFTWWPYAFEAYRRNLGWRIDYFFASRALAGHVKDVEVLRRIRGSDHAPIVLDMENMV